MFDKQTFSSISELPESDPVRLLTWGYILALAIIGFMSIGIHIMIDRIVVEQDNVATIIGKSATQITLAQSVALSASTYVYEKTDAAREELILNASQMRELHNRLVKESFGEKTAHNTAPELLLRIYFEPPYELNKKVISFVDHADQLLAKPRGEVSSTDEHYLYLVRQVNGALGDALAAALASYESSVAAKVSKFQSFQRMAIFVIVMTLICEAFFIFMPLVNHVRNYAEELKKITMTDLLTGIGNRRYFLFRGSQEIQRCRRLKKDLCLALIDLDRFKNINDSYGHKSGDMVLQQFVQIAGQSIRHEDVLARLGGEEFAVLLPHTAIEDAQKVIERMRSSVEKHEFQLDRNFKASITMSAGLTKVNLARDDFETALVLADVALYDAKRTGRNKVVFKEAENFFEEEVPAQNVIPIKPS